MAISRSLRMEVLFSGPCAYCGDPIPTQVDHIMPRSRGGTDDRDNLAPACRLCNMEKLDFTPEEYRAYREEKGLGWPPQSPTDFLKGVLADLKARYPDADLEQVARRIANPASDLSRLPPPDVVPHAALRLYQALGRQCPQRLEGGALGHVPFLAEARGARDGRPVGAVDAREDVGAEHVGDLLVRGDARRAVDLPHGHTMAGGGTGWRTTPVHTGTPRITPG